MKDWIIYSALSLLFWGIWVVLPKFAIKFIDVKKDFIYQTIGGILVGAFFLNSIKFNPQTEIKGIMFALLAGISGALGTFYFLKAMETGKSLVVIPLTSLYPIIGVLLSIFLFNELITSKQVLGIILAMISILLLAS